MFRKILPLLLATILTFAGCGQGGNPELTTDVQTGSAETTAEIMTTAPAEETTEAETRESSLPDPGPHISTEDYVGRTYGIYIGSDYMMDTSIYLTEDGKVYDGMGCVEEVYDAVSGQTGYYAVRGYEISEDGEKKSGYTLYDLEGNPVLDFDYFDYQYCLGELVVRKTYQDWWDWNNESLECGLYNVKTGQYVLEGVCYLTKCDDLVAAYDSSHDILGFLDAEGNIVAGFDDELPGNFFNNYRNGYFLFEDEQLNLWTITDSDFNVIFSGDVSEFINMETSEVKGDYFWVCKDFAYTFYSLAGIEQVYEGTFDYVSYFDGELLLTTSDNRVSLQDINGNVLTGPYGAIVPCSAWDDPEPAECFLAWDESVIYRLNRSGEVTGKIILAGYSDFSVDCCGDYLVVSGSDGNEWKSFILNENLEEIGFDEKYTTITALGLYADEFDASDLFVGYYTTRHGFSRCDLLDGSGEILADNFKVLSVDRDKIVGYKADIVGLLDADGNWLGCDRVYESDMGEDK